MVREVRRSQLQQLRKLIALPTTPMPRLPPAIFIWGPPSTGKTYCLEKSLKKAHILHVARVTATDDMKSKSELRTFLESIIFQLLPLQPNPIKCENLTSFRDQLGSICIELFQGNDRTSKERIVIVVAKAHLLLQNNLDLICELQRLQGITRHNLSVIFCSNSPLPSAKLLPNSYKSSFIVIEFPGYTPEELTTILVSDYPVGPGEVYPAYRFYVSSTVTAHSEYRDLRKIRRFVDLYHPHFERWRLANADLAEFCRRLTPAIENELIDPNSLSLDEPVPCTSCAKNKQRPSINMPEPTKYVCIAAYLASRNLNLSESDQNSSQLQQQVSSSHDANTNSVPMNNRPVQFTQSKLQAMYSQITGNPCSNSMGFMVSVQTLCNLKILVRDSRTLEDPIYRCLAHRDFIKRISESIRFPLEEHLR